MENGAATFVVPADRGGTFPGLDSHFVRRSGASKTCVPKLELGNE